MDDIRVVVGLDFGTTYSGFTYCHVNDKEIFTNDQWPEEAGRFKTNTVLQYDSNFQNVEYWGSPALAKRPSRRNRNETRPVELFKLHLGNLQENLRPKLPVEVEYKKVITDYLFEIGKLIKKTVKKQWSGINFTKHVLLVLTVPAEYSEKDKAIMRKCVYKAELIERERPKNLQFTTEPEAAALHCTKNNLREHNLLTEGTTFMIVDCGGGTVDLTTRKLIENKRLGEITERIGDFCGSTFIDNKFVEFLREKLGTCVIDKLMKNHYGQFQYMVQEFCQRVKMPFSGDHTGFNYELDLEENAPIISKYVSKETEEIMEKNEWLIDIKYDDVKSMFDPIVDRIIRLIDIQLSNNRGTCSAMFLVGGFSQNEYLQKRIKEEYHQKVKIISVPIQPIAAVVRGAALYGLSFTNFLKNPSNAENANKMEELSFPVYTRVLKYTYGVKIIGRWKKEKGHPLNRKIHNDRIYLFETLAKRGTEVEIDKKFISKGYTPLNSNHTALTFELLKSSKSKVKYPDEPEIESVGKLRVLLPDAFNKSITFGFSLGQMEITAFARNEHDERQNFQIKFDLNNENNDL